MSIFEKGKVAVITGAGGGLGRELAVLLRRDYQTHLALCDVDEERLRETVACVAFVTQPLKEENVLDHLRTTTHVVDVSNRQTVNAFAEDVKKIHGHCELLFNSAGIASSFRFDTTDIDEFDQVMAINYGGIVNVTKAFLPYLCCNEKACIVNISSLEGLFPFFPASSASITSKYAIQGFTEALLLESYERFPQVEIYCVSPGLLSTNIISNSTSHIYELGKERRRFTSENMQKILLKIASTTPKQAAEQIISGIQRRNSRIIVGSDAKILDLAFRLFPNFFLRSLPNKILFITTISLTRMFGRRILTLLILLFIWRNFLDIFTVFKKVKENASKLI